MDLRYQYDECEMDIDDKIDKAFEDARRNRGNGEERPAFHLHDAEVSTSAVEELQDCKMSCVSLDIGLDALKECATQKYCRYHGLPKGCATMAQIEDSSAGVAKWASYEGPSLHDYEVPPVSNSEPWNVAQERKR